YNHMNQNFLCALVVLNKKGFEEAGKGVAMQVAAMSPIALNADAVPQDVKDAETRNAIDKAKQNQIGKAVENALKKAGINPAHVDSEDHIESNTAKGWLTAEDAAKAREIKATVAKEAEANLKEQMIENIAKGMVAKFYKENCLLEQAYIDDNKVSVAQYLKNIDKDLTVTDFKRFTLRAE
ncbi:MAG: elongation factor Ts, partial [Bacteroidaceae bacterium]|nr:elongation factor Ts [Bacteroidaceae bacterium]